MSVNIQSPFDPSILGAAMQGFIAYGNRWAQRDIAQAELASQSADRVVSAFTNAFNKAQDLKVAMEQLKIERERVDIARRGLELEEQKFELEKQRAQAATKLQEAQVQAIRDAFQQGTLPFSNISGFGSASGSPETGSTGTTLFGNILFPNARGPEAASDSQGAGAPSTTQPAGGQSLETPGRTQEQQQESPPVTSKVEFTDVSMNAVTPQEWRIIEGIRRDVDTLRMNDQMLAFNILNSKGMPRLSYGSYLRPLA